MNCFQAIEAAIKALKSGSVSSADVARGKEQLKVAVLDSLDSTAGLFENIQTQAVLTGQVVNAADLLAAIDAVKDADVNAVSISFRQWIFDDSSDAYFLCIFLKAAKKVASGKWALGAVGNLATVPHVTDL